MADRVVNASDTFETFRTTFNSTAADVGDIASITYEVVSGENTKLKIGLQNDADDFIELATANGASVKITANTASTNFRRPQNSRPRCR